MFKLTARLTLITLFALVFSLNAKAQVVFNELGIAPASGRAADLDISNAYNSALKGLRPGNLATIKTFTLKVFDRWGQLVFNSNSPFNSWSGTSVNNNLNTTAVFVWYVEYTLVNGTVYKKKGLVTKIL